jgi:hypothetical protein
MHITLSKSYLVLSLNSNESMEEWKVHFYIEIVQNY